MILLSVVHKTEDTETSLRCAKKYVASNGRGDMDFTDGVHESIPRPAFVTV